MDTSQPISRKLVRFAVLRGRLGQARLSSRKVATGAAALLALGVGYHVVFGANGLTVFEAKRQETQSLTTQLDDLRRENDLLKRHVDLLQNDPNAIEHQAREELYALPAQTVRNSPETPESSGR